MRYASWLWTVLLVLPVTRGAADAEPLQLTMKDAVARAISASADLAAARTDIDVARSALTRDSAWLPANPYFTSGAQSTSQTNTPSNYTFYLSQEFEIAGQRGRRMDIDRQDIEKATWDTKLSAQTLTASVKTVFVQGLASLERLALAQKSLAVLSDLTSRTSQRKPMSDSQRFDFNSARIQEVRASRELAGAEQRRDQALNALRRLLGLPVAQEVSLVGTLQSDAADLPPGPELVERALQQRADVVALRYSLQRAESQVDLAKRDTIPNVTLSGTVSQFEGSLLAGGDVTVPLPIFRNRSSEVQSAAAARERTRLLMQSLEQEITKEVLDARRACVVASGDVQAFQHEIVPRNEENLEIERGLHERGAATLTDVVNVQLDVISARRDAVDALETYNTALVELERVLGGNLTP